MSQSAQDMTQCLSYVSLCVRATAVPGVWELEVFLLHCFSCFLSQTRLSSLEAEAASDPQSDSLQPILQNSVKQSTDTH